MTAVPPYGAGLTCYRSVPECPAAVSAALRPLYADPVSPSWQQPGAAEVRIGDERSGTRAFGQRLDVKVQAAFDILGVINFRGGGRTWQRLDFSSGGER